MNMNVLGHCLWHVCSSLSATSSNPTFNWRVRLRKKEWGLSQNEGGGKENLTEVRGLSMGRGGGRVRLISLLEAWRWRLCLSDWSDQEAWCLAYRPEICVFNHALCADVTEMYKQIHINIVLQCDELLPTIFGLFISVWLYTVNLNLPMMAPWWDCMSSLITS